LARGEPPLLRAAVAIKIGALSAHAAAADELAALANRLQRVTVRISTRGRRVDGVGAGILWPLDGKPAVITNAHVVPPRHGDELLIESGGRVLARARVLARDRELDLALLTPADEPNEWPSPAVLGDARALRAGEMIVALGHPFGVGGALSVGVVHAVPNGDDEWLRADIRLAPGNSGGPLATLDGAVVGINCMIARGLGIAIPAHIADRFAREVVSR
jgi:serine protease Do